MNLGETLFVPVNERLGEMGQVLVDLCQGFAIVATQKDFFPQICYF